jgi:hypothetical protein
MLFFDMTITFGDQVKVNVNVMNVFLRHAMQAQSGNGGIALFILNLRNRGGWVINAMP